MKTLLLNLVLTTVFLGVIPAVLIFGLAGHWDLWNVWAYVGISASSLVLQTLVIYRKSPSLLKPRTTVGIPVTQVSPCRWLRAR